MDKKKQQLGVNPSTAAHRLRMDTLFRLAVESGYVCHQCGEELTRENFSIEHKEPWLDSDDPVGNYFDQNNVGFSHLTCNVAARRKPDKMYYTEAERREAQRGYQRKHRSLHYSPEKRREQYLRTGK